MVFSLDCLKTIYDVGYYLWKTSCISLASNTLCLILLRTTASCYIEIWALRFKFFYWYPFNSIAQYIQVAHLKETPNCYVCTVLLKLQSLEFPLGLTRLQTLLVCMKRWVCSLALLSGLRIWHCHELWYSWQIRLRSGVAVAVA